MYCVCIISFSCFQVVLKVLYIYRGCERSLHIVNVFFVMSKLPSLFFCINFFIVIPMIF